MKIYLDSVGCRLNQAEIEHYARQIHAAGHILVKTPEEADLAVINTCTVTAAADSDSRAKIRQAARAGVEQLVATGCWVTLNREYAIEMQGVKAVYSNDEKDNLLSDLLLSAEQKIDLEPLERVLIPGVRFRTRAFIKVQDGCDNRCTFCITTIARGSGVSSLLSDVLAEVRTVRRGNNKDGMGNIAAQEIVLTGVHLGSWGHDFTPPQSLKQLVSSILAESDVPRLRLSSLEPWDLDDDFFELWDNPRLCRHLHLPLQSGSATVLRRMARKTTPDFYAQLVNQARDAIPDVAITTDIIVGFPGETEQEFTESLEFVRQMGFAGGHVFSYSPRIGTAAANMPNQVAYALRKERNARMREVFTDATHDYQRRFIGQTLPVLWESARALGPEGWQLRGLTDNYLRVHAIAPQRLWNEITQVKLLDLSEGILKGKIIID